MCGNVSKIFNFSYRWSTMIFPWYYLPFQTKPNGRCFFFRNESQGTGEAKWAQMDMAPADCPVKVTWLGSPPKLAMFLRGAGSLGVGVVGWLPCQSSKRGEGSSPHHQNPDVWSVWMMRTYMSQVETWPKMKMLVNILEAELLGYVRSGLNSHFFHIRGWNTPIVGISGIKGGMTFTPIILRKLRPWHKKIPKHHFCWTWDLR